MGLRNTKKNRAKESGKGWNTGNQPNVYPGKSAELGAYQKPGKGAGTPQAGGKAGYGDLGPEKTINWPGASK